MTLSLSASVFTPLQRVLQGIRGVEGNIGAPGATGPRVRFNLISIHVQNLSILLAMRMWWNGCLETNAVYCRYLLSSKDES